MGEDAAAGRVGPADGGRPGGAPGAERATVPDLAAWLGWGGLVVAAVAGGLSSGLSGFLSVVGGYLLVVALVALVRGRVGWARLRSRGAGALALGAAVLLLGVGSATASPGGGAPIATPPGATPATASPTPSDARPTPSDGAPAPTPSAETTPDPAPGSALAALAELPVKGRAPKTGYTRDQFGQAWADVDRNGCDTRNDILRRDLQDLVTTAGTHGCVALSGTLHDPYTGATIAFVRGAGTSSAVQIDHVVALSDAWQKGAQQLSRSTRTAFANDPLNLLAVDGPTNEAKGDGDAATWLPPKKDYRCAYVARQVAVKLAYHLWVTAAERDAIARVLGTCPSQPLPAATAIPLGGGSEAVAGPAPATSTPPAPTAPAGATDPRFGTCAAAKAAGYGPYVEGQDPEYAWYRDADHDGVVCE